MMETEHVERLEAKRLALLEARPADLNPRPADISHANYAQGVTAKDSRPWKETQRANFAVVMEGLKTLEQRLNEIESKANYLRHRLTGIEVGDSDAAKRPGENGSIFDHLASQALALAILVGDIDQHLNACQDAVK